jgi:hypothetical protein
LRPPLRSENILHYVLPPQYRSDDNVIKKIISVIYWSNFRKLLTVFLVLLIVFLGFYTAPIIKKELKSLRLIAMIEKKLDKKRISFTKIKRWIKVIFVSLFIACVIFFGFLLIVFTASNYITAILFILLTGLLIYHIFKYIFRKFKMRELYILWLRITIFILLLILICIETFLRSDKTLATYNELQHFFYISGFQEKHVYDKQNPDLMVHSRYDNYIDNRKEFSYEIRTNNEGLRDIDHPIEKSKDECRIICIGNSFTEGIGTPQDSTWTKLLENMLNISSKKKITVLNAGIAGADPFFGYRLLEKKMLKYKPDIVLLAVGSSDFNFYRFRGGFERFTPDGYKFREAPWWESIYAVSYIFRFITDDLMHYKYFFTPDEYKADSVKALMDINDCIHRFHTLTQKNNISFSVVFYDDNSYKLNPVMNSLKKEKIITIFDLAEYNSNIAKINFKDRKSLYWQTDEHCNSRGYEMFARGVEWNLRKFGILDSLQK